LENEEFKNDNDQEDQLIEEDRSIPESMKSFVFSRKPAIKSTRSHPESFNSNTDRDEEKRRELVLNENSLLSELAQIYTQ